MVVLIIKEQLYLGKRDSYRQYLLMSLEINIKNLRIAYKWLDIDWNE